jgi:hypothetical protein
MSEISTVNNRTNGKKVCTTKFKVNQHEGLKRVLCAKIETKDQDEIYALTSINDAIAPFRHYGPLSIVQDRDSFFGVEILNTVQVEMYKNVYAAMHYLDSVDTLIVVFF